MKDLKWTGERLTTAVYDFHGSIEHLHRYVLAEGMAAGLDVLDIASGEGYGSRLLAEKANSVVGVDISAEAVAHASSKYQKRNLSFKVGSTSEIPIPDNSVDLVVSFETLEHHDKHEEMMKEIKRVLRPGGCLILSSPEKSIYWERDPGNPYHIKEITKAELEELLSRHFRHFSVFEQRFVIGSIISHPDSQGFAFYNGDYTCINQGLQHDSFYNKPFFNIAVCSDSNAFQSVRHTSLFDGIKVLRNQLAQVDALRDSASYRLGNLLIRPFSRLKKIISSK